MSQREVSDDFLKPDPQVGVAAIIVGPKGTEHQGKVLIGIRKGSLGEGTWAFPGGHLDNGEEFSECATREVEEETKLKVEAIASVATTNTVFPVDTQTGQRSVRKHYITVFMWCELEEPDATPVIMEKDKCDGWFWKTWGELKELQTAQTGSRLFLPLHPLLTHYPNLDDLRPAATTPV